MIGAVREEGILDVAIIMFTSDLGMPRDYGVWAKQASCGGAPILPMALVGKVGMELSTAFALTVVFWACKTSH